MREIAISGNKREATGKKASKLMRKEGLIPCNLYGETKGQNGLPEALSFAASFAELRKAVYSPHVFIVNLNIDGKERKAIIKELQFHPTTDALLHADFYEVSETKPITVGIPVKLNGLAQGVREGGKLNLSIRKIDVTNLGLGKAIKVGELSFEGLTLATPAQVVVCSVKETRASKAAAAAEAAK